MKRYLAQVGVLAGTLCAGAAAEQAGPYFNVGAGINIVPDVGATIIGDLATVSGDLEFDPGARFSISGGYRFTPIIGVELESGFLYNEVDGTDDVALGQVPILGNIIFRFENNSPVVPFIGGGAGGVLNSFDIDNDDIDEDESDNDFVFAWQAIAGLHFKINDNMSAGVTYKYLGMDSAEFEINDLGTVELDVVHNHSILGSFNWSF